MTVSPYPKTTHDRAHPAPTSKGSRMTFKPLRLLLAGMIAAVAVLAVACGGSSSSDSSSTGGSSAGTPAEGKQGGTLTQLGTSDVDYLDPGHSYFQLGFQVIDAFGRPLYAYKPGNQTRVPDLAQAEPQISDGNKKLTIKIRPNVRFAPPVNRAVTSKDVKYAIERAFSASVGGQYMQAYFATIVGAPSDPPKTPESISGLKTPDDQTLEIDLKDASAGLVSGALELPVTVPVPKEYAKEFDDKTTSTYNEHVVASGPYMVANNAEGKLTGYQPGRRITLVRNPNWDKSTDFKPAYLDKIVMDTNGSDAAVAGQQVLRGSHETLDSSPPATVLQQAVQQFDGQYSQVASGGFRWFPLNTTVKPFDNINVRKAVLAGFDRNAARLARGGKFVGPIGTHFIPPGVPGFEEAGGEKGQGQDYMASPNGNPELAAEYMKKAGYPSGKYTGKEQLLMITTNADPGKAQAQVAQAQLEKLGFKIRLRTVPQDAVYTEWCQVPAKKVAMCGSAGWFKDFADPQSMLDPTFKGSNITKQGNNNMPQLDDPAIDAAMTKAATLTGQERLQAWANIDKMITDQAPAVPFVWDDTTVIFSKDVQAAQNPSHTLIDFNWTSLK